MHVSRENQTFAATRPSAVLLEQLAVCVAKGEPVLLVGETGTGKTSTVQHLARVTGELLNQAGLQLHSWSACCPELQIVSMDRLSVFDKYHC